MDSQLEIKTDSINEQEIASPCVRNCCLDGTEVCLGCFRTLTEILKWNNASLPEKEDILTQCRLRKNAKGPRW